MGNKPRRIGKLPCDEGCNDAGGISQLAQGKIGPPSGNQRTTIFEAKRLRRICGNKADSPCEGSVCASARIAGRALAGW